MEYPITVAESFVKWMEDQLLITFGSNLYLNQVPMNAPNACYWVITSGGATLSLLASGERMQQFSVEINYRDTKGEDVERKLFALSQLLNRRGCLELEGFEVHAIEATQYPTDRDLDDNDRRLGFVIANIQIYKKD